MSDIDAKILKQKQKVQLFADNKEIFGFRGNVANLFSENDSSLSITDELATTSYTGYSGHVVKSLMALEADSMISTLIQRSTDFTCGKFDFHIDEKKAKGEKSKKVFDYWKKNVNRWKYDENGKHAGREKNIQPGLGQIVRWMVRSLLSTGMAVVEYEMRRVKIGGKFYHLPMKMAIHSSQNVWIQRKAFRFFEEDIWLVASKKEVKEIDNDPQTVPMKGPDEGGAGTAEIPGSGGLRGIKLNNAFAIRFNYDLQTKSPYPMPFLRPIMKEITLRQRLIESDISLLEDIITAILMATVEDPAPPQRDENGTITDVGDIVKVSDALVTGEIFQTIVVPGNVKVAYILPDLESLLSAEKYTPVNQAILQYFGLVQDADPGRNTGTQVSINIKGLEYMIAGIREHIEGYFDWITDVIIDDDKNKGLIKPIMRFDPLNLESDAVIQTYMMLADKGYMSIETLLEKIDLDIATEKNRLEKEKDEGFDELFVVRATFAQETVDGSGKITKNETNKQPGRPRQEDTIGE